MLVAERLLALRSKDRRWMGAPLRSKQKLAGLQMRRLVVVPCGRAMKAGGDDYFRGEGPVA